MLRSQPLLWQHIPRMRFIGRKIPPTVIKRLTLRGALERQEPGFIVTPLVTKEAVQQSELENLCNRIFAGSSKDMILSFLSRESVDEQQLAELKKAVEEYHR